MTLLAPSTTEMPTGTPFRVLYVLPDLQIGGGQTIVLNGVRHLDRSQFEPVVAYLLDGDEMAPAFRDAGCPPVHVPYRRRQGLRTVAELVRLIRREQIDLVHVQSPLDRTYGQIAALITGTPVVGQLHAMFVHFGPNLPERPSAMRRLRASLLARVRNSVEARTVKRYEADSADVRDLFTPLVDVPISVTRQAIATDAFDEAMASGARERIRAELGLGDAPVLVNVSRLVEGKGQEHLLAVMDRLRDRHPRAVLVLVGDGDRRAELERETDALGLADRVVFLGNRFDIPDLLVASDVFVFGSESEGFGLVALEAMAASKPVVAFRLSALQEFVDDGTSGHLVDLGDVDAMARHVDELLTDETKAAAMGRAGRRIVDERFHPRATSESFERAYRAVLAGSQPRAQKVR